MFICTNYFSNMTYAIFESYQDERYQKEGLKPGLQRDEKNFNHWATSPPHHYRTHMQFTKYIQDNVNRVK